jgi:hypothetical protein
MNERSILAHESESAAYSLAGCIVLTDDKIRLLLKARGACARRRPHRGLTPPSVRTRRFRACRAHPCADDAARIRRKIAPFVEL